ncbi:uroporphyrinogen-III synthase [Brumimicrobium mesophilum]|uniref:uroporphyrinogen-III synthase n=1 Tax=Brumimicrobium mesophilum TaxID=392717 RepID=UPI000D1413CA|nr:uroporphyrinogen-III synthase [Brumimicrobium mesophilum]
MLFVSKKVTQPEFLAYVNAAEINMIDTSMISFEAVPIECPESKYEVVFFTSPRSAQFFLNSCEIPHEVEIATIGKVTSDFVETKGYSIAFTGVTSGIPSIVSEEFKAFVGERKVLFPQSNYSQRSMQASLDTHQIIDLVVYKTVLTPIKLIAQPSILVFTSPTNVESFLQLNEVSESQKVIAWGKTTEAFLSKNGIKSDFTLKYSSFEELQKILVQLKANQ